MSAFTIELLKSFPPGADPMREDFCNMGTGLGSNVMMLHKTFPSDKMPWMVLVHIPTGERILISFPEEKELSPEEAIDIMAGGDVRVGGEVAEPLESSVQKSLDALKEVGAQSPDNTKTQPIRPRPFVKGSDRLQIPREEETNGLDK